MDSTYVHPCESQGPPTVAWAVYVRPLKDPFLSSPREEKRSPGVVPSDLYLVPPYGWGRFVLPIPVQAW